MKTKRRLDNPGATSRQPFLALCRFSLAPRRRRSHVAPRTDPTPSIPLSSLQPNSSVPRPDLQSTHQYHEALPNIRSTSSIPRSDPQPIPSIPLSNLQPTASIPLSSLQPTASITRPNLQPSASISVSSLGSTASIQPQNLQPKSSIPLSDPQPPSTQLHDSQEKTFPPITLGTRDIPALSRPPPSEVPFYFFRALMSLPFELRIKIWLHKFETLQLPTAFRISQLPTFYRYNRYCPNSRAQTPILPAICYINRGIFFEVAPLFLETRSIIISAKDRLWELYRFLDLFPGVSGYRSVRSIVFSDCQQWVFDNAPTFVGHLLGRFAWVQSVTLEMARSFVVKGRTANDQDSVSYIKGKLLVDLDRLFHLHGCISLQTVRLRYTPRWDYLFHSVKLENIKTFNFAHIGLEGLEDRLVSTSRDRSSNTSAPSDILVVFAFRDWRSLVESKGLGCSARVERLCTLRVNEYVYPGHAASRSSRGNFRTPYGEVADFIGPGL